jgi:hypothetical protein
MYTNVYFCNFYCLKDKDESDQDSPLFNVIDGIERQASSTIEAFLLENDDPRVLSARAAEWRESKTVEWTRCQSRHTRERFENEIGDRRPVTNWMQSG